MSSKLSWANNSQEKNLRRQFFNKQMIILEVEENICHKSIPTNPPTPI